MMYRTGKLKRSCYKRDVARINNNYDESFYLSKLKRSCYKKYVARINNNNDDDESFNPRSKEEEEDEYSFLENLFHRRGSIREEGLTTMLKKFRSKIQLEFAENNFVTILYRCENSIKRGSTVEIKLASQAIGLLALTVGRGNDANEIYRECLNILPRALSLKSKAQPVPILECLAIVTFVGAEDVDETERSMKIIWEYIINHKSEILVSSKKESALVIAAAISAWSFLLTTIDRWRLHHKCWKGVIPHFLQLLEAEAEEAEVEAEADDDQVDIDDEAEDVDIDDEAEVDIDDEANKVDEVEAEAEDQSPYLAIVEALALVFEKGNLEKFYSQPNESFCNVSNLFKDKKSHQTSLNIYGTTLTFSTWSQLKKMSYLKHFLGNGFRKHVVDNEFLRDDVFHYKPSKKFVGTVLYMPEMEEIAAEIFIPDVRNKDCRQRLFKSPNSIMSKGKTRLLKKKRMLAQGMKTGHYDSVHDDETHVT